MRETIPIVRETMSANELASINALISQLQKKKQEIEGYLGIDRTLIFEELKNCRLACFSENMMDVEPSKRLAALFPPHVATQCNFEIDLGYGYMLTKYDWGNISLSHKSKISLIPFLVKNSVPRENITFKGNSLLENARKEVAKYEKEIKDFNSSLDFYYGNVA